MRDTEWAVHAHVIHTITLQFTCGSVSPAGRPHSSHACSLFQPIHGGGACTVRSLSPMRCEHARDRRSCAPVEGNLHILITPMGYFNPLNPRNLPVGLKGMIKKNLQNDLKRKLKEKRNCQILKSGQIIKSKI